MSLANISGLEELTRQSLPSISRNVSEASIWLDGLANTSSDTKEKEWSWFYLRDRFRRKDMESLFEKYEARLQHSFFVICLMVAICYNLVVIALYSWKATDIKGVSLSLTLRGIGLAIQVPLFVLSYQEHLFRTAWIRTMAASAATLAMVCSEHGAAIGYFVNAGENCTYTVRPTYFILLNIMVTLPFPRRWQSALAYILVFLLELTVSGINHGCWGDKYRGVSFNMLVNEFIFNLMAGIVGLYITVLMEITNRRAFLDKTKSLESKFLLDNEKSREEELLQSILPRHIASRVRDDIREVMLQVDRNQQLPTRPFHELYVKRYTNVSIVYADIVNSMSLTASLSANELVETLNELFGKFDESAEKNNCMRIKLLGDCYYCVSGIPDPDPRHAINCVQMGLDMIDIIQVTKEERQVNVNMRIGVHTGNVLSGLLGLRKWQYDIWSRDVIVASRMEQSGKPGLVHISKTTLDHLGNEFRVVPGNGRTRDEYLAQEEIETFFVVPRTAPPTPHIETKLNGVDHNGHPNNHALEGKMYTSKRRGSSAPIVQHYMKRRKSSVGEVLSSRRRDRGAVVVDSTIITYGNMLKAVKSVMASAIDKMPLSKTDQWFHPKDIQPLFLHFGVKFPNLKMERDYINQPDPLFKYYLFCVLLVFVAMTIIHLYLTECPTTFFWLTYVPTFIVIFVGCLMTWTGYFYIWMKTFRAKRREVPRSLLFTRHSKNVFSWCAKGVSNHASVRVFFWLVISVLMLVCALGDSEKCTGITVECASNDTSTEDESFTSSYNPSTTHGDPSSSPVQVTGKCIPQCRQPWYYIFCVVLAMTATSVFLRINFLLKMAANLSALLYFWTVTKRHETKAFSLAKVYFSEWKALKDFDPDIGHCFFLTLVFVILHVLDRQVEYVCRLDYLSKKRLEDERVETNIIKNVNNILLHNILPRHVANYYLNKEYRHTDEIYHESYQSVAVIFASIPHFSLFYTENAINDEGLECLRFLNEIICAFDRLLFLPVFTKVEKIKTIGSTYMAAVGLQPGRGSADSLNNFLRENPLGNALTMVKFAEALMEHLSDANKHGFQDFSLRIGIALGPVTAGVVGENKPQYDIWGDTVNVASRMESTGIMGRIHVTENVARLLMNEGTYKCVSRGEIFVKGKGKLTTYLVETPFDEPDVEVTHI